jgi:hypothetical protein
VTETSLRFVWQVAWREFADPDGTPKGVRLDRFKAVGAMLALRWDADGRGARMSIKTLAENAGCSERHARAGIRALEAGAWIVQTRRGGGRRQTSWFDASLPQTVHTVPGLGRAGVVELQERLHTVPGSTVGTRHSIHETRHTSPKKPAGDAPEEALEEFQEERVAQLQRREPLPPEALEFMRRVGRSTDMPGFGNDDERELVA